jgi:ABC transport system ATP-binding/permease protein
LPPIINAQNISKAFGAKPLFEHVSFTVSETDRIGLIGPNGSGKSTLLRILAATETPDAGNLPVRKRLRLSYVEQDSKFIAGASVRSVIEKAVEGSATAAAARGTILPKYWVGPASRISKWKRRRIGEAGRSGWLSSSRWFRR